MMEVLEALLQFNQLFRLSAKECLHHTLFDGIRSQSKEQEAPYQINLQCDGINYYDYEKDQDKFCSDASGYKALILEEARLLR